MRTLTDVEVKKVVAVLQILRAAKENEFSDTDKWIKTTNPSSIYDDFDAISYAYGFLKTLNDYITSYMLNYHPTVIEVYDSFYEKLDQIKWFNVGSYKAYRFKELVLSDLEANNWDVIKVVELHSPEILLSLLEN